MAVICFSSLKGGVGKTTLSLSVASAFAERGCETLLIDLDPAEHASRFFWQSEEELHEVRESPLARLFLATGDGAQDTPPAGESLIETALSANISLIKSVRSRFALLPAGPELRHFLWGKGSRAFKGYFPRLLEELNSSYDYVIIDTPPDYNVLTRNAIAAADLVVVPIDPSIMSINCLERLVAYCSHIQGPAWSIMRTMVNRQASRVQKMSQKRLNEKLTLRSGGPFPDEEDDDFGDFDLQDADSLLAMFDKDNGKSAASSPAQDAKTSGANDSPIYLLNSVVYRTEEQNKLSFLGKTAFDVRTAAKLAQQYLDLARELEQILSYDAEPINVADNFLPNALEQMQASRTEWEPVSKYRSTSY